MSSFLQRELKYKNKYKKYNKYTGKKNFQLSGSETSLIKYSNKISDLNYEFDNFICLKNYMETLYIKLFKFIIEKLDYKIEYDQLSQIVGIYNNIKNLDIDYFYKKAEDSKLTDKQEDYVFFYLDLLNIKLPPDHESLLRGGSEQKDWYGCVNPDLSKLINLSEEQGGLTHREKARLCQKNKGYPVNKFFSRTNCSDAILHDPHLCNPNYQDNGKEKDTFKMPNIQLNAFYDFLTLDILKETFWEIDNSLVGALQTGWNTIVSPETDLQFSREGIRTNHVLIVARLRIYLFLILTFGTAILVIFCLILMKGIHSVKESEKRYNLQREREEQMRQDQIRRRERERLEEIRRRTRERQKRERNRRLVVKGVKKKFTSAIKKLNFMNGFITAVQIEISSDIRKGLDDQTINMNIWGNNVLVFIKGVGYGTIHKKTRSLLRPSKKDTILFRDGTTEEIFLGQTRNYKTLFNKTKVGKEFRFVMETLPTNFRKRREVEDESWALP